LVPLNYLGSPHLIKIYISQSIDQSIHIDHQNAVPTTNQERKTKYDSYGKKKMTTPYPTRTSIHALFLNMETGNHAEVFKRVSPDVEWTVMGTHPCAGRYTE